MNQESPLQYQIHVESTAQHLFNITLKINSRECETLHLRLPTWIPGSYMVRDFAKNIVKLALVSNGDSQARLVQLDKQSWQITGCGDKTEITYQVYAYDLSVRCAFLDDQFGFANGTSVFLQVDEFKDHACTVQVAPVEEQPQWSLYTAMAPVAVFAKGYGLYQAKNYADLIEHPLTWACADVIRFTEENIEFSMIFVGGHQADLTRIKKDLQAICKHHLKLFDKGLDIDKYLFITMLTESDYGGLEHTHSTALLFSRNDLPSITQAGDMTDGYRSFLGLCSHELFHTWHVKRIKPKCLLTPDLSREVYTEQLWIYEGFTSYYDDFSLLRTGLIDTDSYLELMGQNLTRLQRTQGRFTQTVTQSSFEAWSKFYKQDENAQNAIVSYYNKGAVIALCLDLKIRQLSRQTYSLDSVMRFLWKHYGIDMIGTDDDVIHLVLKDGLGLDLDEFLNTMLYSHAELPTESLLAEFGIAVNYRARTNLKDTGGKAAKADSQVIDLGMSYKEQLGGILVQQVSNHRAANLAGLQKGDHIIAINGWQATGKQLESEFAKYPQGTKVPLSYFRRGKLCTTPFPIQAAVKDTVYLTIADREKARLWLGDITNHG